MQLTDIGVVTEMSRPAKICPKCHLAMAKNHYWYKGGWKCKSKNVGKTKEEAGKETPAEPPRKNEADRRREDPHTITAMDVGKIKATTVAGARAAIDSAFPKAGPEAKAYAMRIWSRLNRNAPAK